MSDHTNDRSYTLSTRSSFRLINCVPKIVLGFSMRWRKHGNITHSFVFVDDREPFVALLEENVLVLSLEQDRSRFLPLQQSAMIAHPDIAVCFLLSDLCWRKKFRSCAVSVLSLPHPLSRWFVCKHLWLSGACGVSISKCRARHSFRVLDVLAILN